ncbi:S-layer homology domain-containing protein [Flavonifractor sp. An306]|uniref:S-layer homology domain-containing protein n=1 Tax=Flavonifractor sp. An306 TaxID=1965629 RepID=UPI00174D7F0C|nr:S-layer homology domain-containing protein [Flavonifractor sp. An306]
MRRKRGLALLLAVAVSASLTVPATAASPQQNSTGPYQSSAHTSQSLLYANGPFNVENISNVTYNGNYQTPKPVVTDSTGIYLEEGQDYVLSYRDNQDAGQANIHVQGIGAYEGVSTDIYFNIRKADLYIKVNDVTCRVNESPSFSYELVGGQLYGNDRLPEPTYTLSGKVGNTAKINATFDGLPNYNIVVTKGTLTYTSAEVGTVSDVTYNGNYQTPKPAVTDSDGTPLVENYDYTLNYRDNRNAGTGYVEVRGIGRYAGQIDETLSFSIKKAPLTITVGNVTCNSYETPKFTYSITSGQLFESDNLGTPEYKTQSRSGHTYGPEFDIDVAFSSADSKNYDITVNKGLLTYTDINYQTYIIDVDSNSGGSISPSGRTYVYGGNNQTFQFNPRPGYEVIAVYVDGRDIGSRSGFTFYDVSRDHELYVDFAPISGRYDIEADCSSGGRISPSGTVHVDWGDNQTFWAIPNDGYTVKAVYVDGRDVGDVDSYTFRDVRKDHRIYVEFVRTSTLQYRLDASSDSHGTISPDGSLWVKEGSSKTFTFKPDSGYQVDAVYVDGKKLSTRPSSYTFSNIREAHSIYVEFTRGSYEVKADCSSGGRISPSSSTTMVPSGSSKTFSFTPNSGYGVLGVYLDGEYVGNDRSYTFRDMSTDHELYVKFAKISEIQDEYDIRVIVSPGGTVSPYGNGKISVPRGEDQHFYITPNHGYHIARIYIDDKQVSVDTEYSFKAVVEDHTMRVEFESGLTIQPPGYWINPYTDIRPGSWYYDSVRFMSWNGLVWGTSATTFSPHETVSRAMLVTILYRMEGSPSLSPANVFADVSPNAWFGNAVNWAAKEGIATGYGDGRFHPDDAVTREQMASILYRYAQYRGLDLSAASDISTRFIDYPRISGYAVTPLSWAYAHGIISGANAYTLAPTGTATRAEVSTMMARFCQSFLM